MTYGIGAVHVVTGKGVLTVNNPIGVLAVTTTVPPGGGVRVDSPPSYWGIGQLRPGNTDGWFRSYPLQTIATLLYPFNDMVTRLGYTIPAGASCTITELTGSVPNYEKQPWDRNPTAVVLGANATVAGGASGTIWTYTVATGRKLLVADGECFMTRVNSPTGAGLGQVQIRRAGVAICQILDYSAPAAFRDRDVLSPAGLVLLAGEVLDATYADTFTGGNAVFGARLSGISFDA